MTLDPRFVIAPSLQEYFVDKDTGDVYDMRDEEDMEFLSN